MVTDPKDEKDTEDLKDYYTVIRALSRAHQIKSWQVEFILVHSFAVSTDYVKGLPLVLITNILKLKSKEIVKVMRRWAGKFDDFAQLVLNREIEANLRFIYGS